MASPAQVPNNFNNAPWSRPVAEYQAAPQAPLEGYRYPTMPEAPQAPVYPYQPAPFNTAPPHNIPQPLEKKPKSNKNKVIAGIAAGALTVVAGGIGFGIYNGNKAVGTLGSGAGADRDNAVPYDGSGGNYENFPVKLTAENATGDQFANLDPDYPYPYSTAEQMDYIGPKLNEGQQEATDRIRNTIGSSHFTEDDGITPRKIVEANIDNTPQQILDQIAVGIFRSWEMAQTGNIDEAKKYAAGVADPKHREYKDQVDLFTSNLPSMSEGVAWNEQPAITSGNYEGVEATSENPVMEFNSSSTTNTSSVVKMVVRFDKGTESESGRWRLVVTKSVE